MQYDFYNFIFPAIFVLTISARLDQVTSDDSIASCQDFHSDFCHYDPETILNGFEFPDGSEKCQQKCREYPNCELFHYNFRQKTCFLLNQTVDSYFKSCSKFAGPNEPSIYDCQKSRDNCLALRKVDCLTKGYQVDNLQFIQNEIICQFACNLEPECDYFVYDKEQQNCELIHGQKVECDLMIGPPDPLIRSCKNFTEIQNFTEITTSTPSTTTTATITTPIRNNYISITLIDENSRIALKNATVSAIYQSNRTDMTTNNDGMAGQFGPYDMNAYVTIQSELPGYINETVVVHIAEEIRDNAHHVIDKTIEMTWNGERKLKINQILIAVLVMLSSINLLK